MAYQMPAAARSPLGSDDAPRVTPAMTISDKNTMTPVPPNQMGQIFRAVLTAYKKIQKPTPAVARISSHI
jgi:hypothetical protein